MSFKQVPFVFALFFTFLFSASFANAQVLLTDFSAAYTQNFDSLASGANNATFTWTDNSTLTGWYSTRTLYRVSAGTVNNGDLYSYGVISTSDRALGSVASNSTGTVQYGVRIQNNTGATLTEFTLSCTGEQWRDGGGTTAVPNTLTFAYSVDATSLTAGTYTNVSKLNFTGPINSLGSGGALDGNASANRVLLSGTVSGLSLASGKELWLRWADINDTGNDHGLAIDDLRFTARGATVAAADTPEPGLSALLGGLVLSGCGVLKFYRRARKS